MVQAGGEGLEEVEEEEQLAQQVEAEVDHPGASSLPPSPPFAS